MAEPFKATPAVKSVNDATAAIPTRNWKNISKTSIHTEGAVTKGWYKLAPGDVVAAPEGEFAHLPANEIELTNKPATVGAGKSAAEDLAGAKKQGLVKKPRKNLTQDGRVGFDDDEDDDE